MTIKEPAKYLKIWKSTLYRMAREFLGHKSSITIEIYTHISAKNLFALKNPLDSILKGGKT